MSERSSFRIAIVGGGLIGLSCAFALSQRGARVSLFDQGVLGGGASGASAGMLAPGAEAIQEGGSEAYTRFCIASLEQWPGFARRVEAAGGGQINIDACGSILPCRSLEDAEALAGESLIKLLSPRALDKEKLTAAAPALSDDIPAALLLSAEAHLDPRQAARALEQALHALDVSIHEQARALALETKGERVSGLVYETGGETRRAAFDAVLVCSGVSQALRDWAPSLSRLKPVKGQMAALEAGGLDLPHIIRGEAYLVPRSGHEIWVGASVEPDRDDVATDQGVIGALLEKAAALIPGLEGRAVIRTWAGIRPGTVTGHPLIGAESLGGLYLACGHYRNGVLAAPATAQAVSRLILDGDESGLG